MSNGKGNTSSRAAMVGTCSTKWGLPIIRTVLVLLVLEKLLGESAIVEAFSLPMSSTAQRGISSTSAKMSMTSSSSMSPSSTSTANHILFDMPVSNNGARCRLILYKVRYGGWWVFYRGIMSQEILFVAFSQALLVIQTIFLNITNRKRFHRQRSTWSRRRLWVVSSRTSTNASIPKAKCQPWWFKFLIPTESMD